ncbi:unnamed protein product, partial [marine sediment metagenome]
MRSMLKGKIHRARVTDVCVDYEGSIGIDGLLLEAADILPYEKVHVLDINNGARFETYAVEAEKGSGEISLLGAAARLVSVGDKVIILAYDVVTEEEAQHWHPKLVYVDEKNA